MASINAFVLAKRLKYETNWASVFFLNNLFPVKAPSTDWVNSFIEVLFLFLATFSFVFSLRDHILYVVVGIVQHSPTLWD